MVYRYATRTMLENATLDDDAGLSINREEKETNMRKRAMQRQRFPNTNMQPGISQ
jgi:hypothetical protein